MESKIPQELAWIQSLIDGRGVSGTLRLMAINCFEPVHDGDGSSLAYALEQARSHLCACCRAGAGHRTAPSGCDGAREEGAMTHTMTFVSGGADGDVWLGARVRAHRCGPGVARAGLCEPGEVPTPCAADAGGLTRWPEKRLPHRSPTPDRGAKRESAPSASSNPGRDEQI